MQRINASRLLRVGVRIAHSHILRHGPRFTANVRFYYLNGQRIKRIFNAQQWNKISHLPGIEVYRVSDSARSH